MVLPPVDHDCILTPFLHELAERMTRLEQENAQLKKALYGARSERSKLPRIKTAEPPTPEQTQAKRRSRAV